MKSPNRRQFIAASAATSATLALAGAASAKKNPKPETNAALENLFEISLAQWSLHRRLRGGDMDNLDFAKVAKEEFSIEAIEYVNQFFKDKAKDEKYLGEMVKRSQDHGVKALLIMIDGEGNLGDADEAKRKKAVENHHKWVDAAKFMGCHSIRVNAASGGTYREQVERAVDGLSSLCEYAAQDGIGVIVENHGGFSSNGQWLAQVIRKVDKSNCGTLPDFGNFVINRGGKGSFVEYDRYLGMASLMPFAKAVSAKSHQFDAEGNETKTDYMKMLTIMLDAGYRGHVGVEYEGEKLSESEGIKATKALLEKCRTELVGNYSNA
jgi:sugar phosphate isomerase/epimerase